MNDFEAANTKLWTENDPELVFACPTPGDAEPIMKLLVRDGFQPTVTVATPHFNPNYAFSREPDHVRLWVHREDYAAAREVLVRHLILADVPEDTAMQQMYAPCTDAELLQLIACESLHSPNDVVAAHKILEQRATPLDPFVLEQMHHDRLQQMRKQGHVSIMGAFWWLFWTLVHPPFSLTIAILIYYFKGQDMEGHRYFLYSQQSRAIAIFFAALSLGLMALIHALLAGLTDDLGDVVLLSLSWLVGNG